jgi:anti-sigma-K factor RskA
VGELADPQEVLIDIRERLVRVETKLDNQNDLRDRTCNVEEKATETEARSKSNTHRIDKLEEANVWLWRTFAGAIIVAGVSAVVIFK